MTLILSGTDGVSDVDGSAATPAVRGADANTGIFFPAADTIAFAEGGVEVARITNTSAWSFGASGTATGTSGQVLASAGSGAAPTWINLPAGSEIIRVARTSNTALTSANRGNLIDITSGTFTQTFDACASLGNGWFCYLDNSGTGDITLDPNGSETIDGLTSYIMYPGEVRLVQCDGTALRTIVLNAFYATFTTSGTFTKPPGYSAFEGLLWAGGGGGGKTSIDANIGGGGGGACFPFTLLSTAVGSSETVTIGSGGTGTSTNGANGSVGGNSSFGGLVTSFGGGGGGGSSSANRSGGGGGGAFGVGGGGGDPGANGGAPFTGSVGATNPRTLDQNFGGGGAQSSLAGASFYGGGAGGSGDAAGGASAYGGGGGGGVNGNISATSGGISRFGGSGGAGSRASSGTNGTAPAGGGGATQSGTKGGDGARGELRIWGIV